jgi:hypothetical protein
MDADERDRYVTAATRASASVDGLWGITWWCSHDIDRSLAGFAELEYDLGLLTVDNEVKPLGARMRETIESIRSDAAGLAIARPIGLVLPDATLPDLAFADAFFALIEQGVRPAIVLGSKVDDRGYLAARGIAELRSVESGARS